MQMILKANCWLAMPIIIITKLWPRFSLKLLKVNTNIMLLVLSGEIFQSCTTNSMFLGGNFLQNIFYKIGAAQRSPSDL